MMRLVWVVIPLVLFGVIGVQESFTDTSNNTKHSQEKIVITMIPNSNNPYACDPSIPPYDKPNCFLPAIAYVNIGQPVVFENSKPGMTVIASGNPQHGPDGVFESPPIPPGSSYEVSFDKEGIYNYFDFVAPWMAGTIIVGTSTTNLPPIANAGQDRIIVEGKSVQLSIVGDDPENGKFRYSWQQVSGPTVKLSNVYYPEGSISNDYPYLHTASKTIYFTAPNVYATTSFVFEGTVIDNTLQRSTDTVQITIVDDFSSKNYPIAITEDFDELDKTLEDAKEKLETVMSSGDGTITINMLFVDGVNHMLVVGITPSDDVLSIEDYEIRIKEIVGDIPMNVGFASFVEEDILLVKKILSPLKQIKNGMLFNDVECKRGLIQLFKSSNNLPTCVKPATAEKLIQRGWAMS